jgi:hypothetical protein
VKKHVLWISVAVAPLMLSCLVCGPACAQSPKDFLAAADDNENTLRVASLLTTMAAQFPPTDASLTVQTSLENSSFLSLFAADPGNLATDSPTNVTSTDAIPSRAANPAIPSPAPRPKPRPYYYENPNKWQLGVTFAFVRFRSSVYSASAPGLNTSLAYWLREWIAIEGSVTSAFASPVFQNEHFRYLGYAAGPKFSFGHGRLEPWAHALVGGVHLIPQTASGGQNGAEFTIGGGVDYALNNVISAKAGVDYLGTHMFGEWQSSPQILAGFSFRF